MSSELWHVTEHIIPASYPRGFTRGVRDPQTSRLRLSVKEYVPKTQPTDVGSTGVTFITLNGAANGKESYEPMFDDLLHAKPRAPFHIHRILNMDPAHQGISVNLNIEQIGDGPHVSDQARDILAIANHFQTALQPPCIGVGQSYSCAAIATTTALHPRIFDGVVLLEPLFCGPLAVHEMAKRRDWWPDRAAALLQYRKNPWYGTFEPRVLAKLIEFELRDVPTRARPGVTLMTPKAMDFHGGTQPLPPIEEAGGEMPVDREMESKQRFFLSRLESYARGFFAPSLQTTLESIARMLPQVLYVWGGVSDVWGRDGYGEALVGLTGVARGGSGGRERGMVEEAWVQCGHGPPFQAPRETGMVVAKWLERRMVGWREEGRRAREAGLRMRTKDLDRRWLDRLSGRDGVDGKGKL
ncbi:hypothetical protein K490DRAFT_32335 [Saccharata proteae CBS 121410]|uniref:Alpha/beta-hydrolase n=1 Tax=Saccharata proteae CBS 121410 TaxID=1314787 RepID=A0A9P4I1I3_9PEZI|nr:hypothetical protein K490DRAFT_32335 [Saccharata proteae CBS 121410]